MTVAASAAMRIAEICMVAVGGFGCLVERWRLFISFCLEYETVGIERCDELCIDGM